jgi:hypothetical protein
MITTAFYLTVTVDPDNSLVTIANEAGDTMVTESFEGPIDKVLEFVDEMGMVANPTYKILDKHLPPDESTPFHIVWDRVPIEYDEDNATA